MSPRTPTLILPLHRELDALREEAAGANKIGTTGRGIGPGLRGQGRAPRHPRAGPAQPDDARAQGRSHPRAPQRAAPRARPAGDLQREADGRACRDRAQDPAVHGRDLGPARPRAQGRQAHSVRGRAGRAARHRPWHLSVRDVVQHGRRAGCYRLRRRPARDRLRARHRQGLHHAGRFWPVPDRTARRHRASASASAGASSAR